MINNFIKKNIYSILLFLLWLAHLINLYIWLKLDVNYFTYDSHRHFLVSLRIFEEFKRLSPDFLSRCISLTQRHPPLVMMITAPFYFIFGRSQDAGAMLNGAIFLGILIFATYKIGQMILNSRSGFFAAFILTMYPVVFNQLKVYMLDLPLTAAVSLSIYFLLRSNNFKSLKYTLLFLITLTSGLLIKTTFILFIILPFAYSIFKNCSFHKIKNFLIRQKNKVSSNSHKRKWRKELSPFGLVLILALLIILITLCTLYYFSSDVYIASVGRGSLIEKGSKAVFRSLHSGPGNLRTWPAIKPRSVILLRIHALVWYLWGLINWQISSAFFAIFIIGSFFFIKNKLPYKNLIIIWFLGSLILISNFNYGSGRNMEVSAVRYTMPFLPAVAIISATGIMRILLSKPRRILIIMTIIFALLQFIFISYPFGVKLAKIEVPFNFKDKYDFFPPSLIIFKPTRWAVSGSDSGSQPSDFSKYIRGCEEIFSIVDPKSDSKVETVVTIIFDDTRFWYLQYLTYIRNRPIKINCDYNYMSLVTTKWKIWADIFCNADYVLDKHGGWLGEPYMRGSMIKARESFDFYKNDFYLFKELGWPDNGKIMVFKRK